jgi:hypothetical protein
MTTQYHRAVRSVCWSPPTARKQGKWTRAKTDGDEDDDEDVYANWNSDGGYGSSDDGGCGSGGDGEDEDDDDAFVSNNNKNSTYSVDRLLDPTINTHGVLSDVAQLFPPFNVSAERMRSFAQFISAAVYPRPIFPMQSTGGDEFPDFDPVLDAEWRRRVRDEPPLTPGSHHPGLDPDKRLLVKPYQTLDAPLAILSSCSTKKTTRHKYYGVIRDISNPCISILLAKISFWDTTTQTKPVLMLDMFPRRIDRKDFSCERAEDLMKKLPRQLVEYWKYFTLDMLQRSSAKVVVVMGT